MDRTAVEDGREDDAMQSDAESVAADVDAAAASFGIALSGERRTAVIAWFARLRDFALDVAAVDTADAGAAP